MSGVDDNMTMSGEDESMTMSGDDESMTMSGDDDSGDDGSMTVTMVQNSNDRNNERLRTLQQIKTIHSSRKAEIHDVISCIGSLPGVSHITLDRIPRPTVGEVEHLFHFFYRSVGGDLSKDDGTTTCCLDVRLNSAVVEDR
jgi:hypothetical protein